jgi:hypothetical protein
MLYSTSKLENHCTYSVHYSKVYAKISVFWCTVHKFHQSLLIVDLIPGKPGQTEKRWTLIWPHEAVYIASCPAGLLSQAVTGPEYQVSGRGNKKEIAQNFSSCMLWIRKSLLYFCKTMCTKYDAKNTCIN